MNLKNLIKKISFVVILLQINHIKCAEDPLDNYVSDVTKKSLSTQKSDWYLNFTKYSFKNPCGDFNNWFQATNINSKNKQSEDAKKFIECMLFLAQNSKNCWLSLIKDVQRGSDQTFLLERMAHSALRSYIYLLIENRKKYPRQKSIWQQTFKERRERAKLLLQAPLKEYWDYIVSLFRGIPDFYLIAAVEGLKEMKNGSYENFLKDLSEKVREYLSNIPEEFKENLSAQEIKNLQFSEQEIQEIINNLKSKLNPSHMRKYLKFYLSAGVVVVGVGYLLYKNRMEIQRKYQKGGLGEVFQYGWQGVKNTKGDISRGISRFAAKFTDKTPLSAFKGVDPAGMPYIEEPRQLEQWLTRGSYDPEHKRDAIGFVDKNNRFWEYTKEELWKFLKQYKNQKPVLYRGVALPKEWFMPVLRGLFVPKDMPLITGNPLHPADYYLPK